MSKKTAGEFRPFHETILEIIDRVSCTTELRLLAELIYRTKIPKGHDEIAAAWCKRCKDIFESLHCVVDYLSVPASLVEQKRAADEQEKKQVEIPIGTH